MRATIIKGGNSSFILMNSATKQVGINIGPSHDMLDVFKWANETYRAHKDNQEDSFRFFRYGD